MVKKKDRKIDFRENIKEYWSILSEHKVLFFSLVFLGLILEALKIIPSFLFKELVDKGEKFGADLITKIELTDVLLIIAGIFILTTIARSIIRWMVSHFLIFLDTTMVQNLKTKYFNHILELSHNFHTTHKTGALISRLGRGSAAIESLNDILIFQILPLFFNLILVGFSLAYFSTIPAIVIAIVVIIFVSYSFWIQQLQQKYKLIFNSEQDREKGMVGDVFTNVDSIKYFGKEKFIQKKFLKKVEETKSASRKYWGFFRWFDAGQTLILAAGTFFLLYFPLKEFLAGEITLGTIVFIYTIYGNVTGPMFYFVWGIRGFYRVMADFQDLFEYGKITNDIKDKAGSKNLQIKKGEIEFRDVDFDYEKRKLFQKFNLKIKPNEKVALVGHSGCGKTTLVNLLKRFFDVKKGNILIDGKDIREFTQESIRSETGIVPQECILFDDTIYNNIKFANPSATRKEVFDAIKFAQLTEIISSFPKKENTIVGERGVKLSGGEKQRVSIARAILANKKVLILDEATSALDSETEYEIQRDLQKLLKGRTSIIIAHRLSTIMTADRIIVLKKGKIIEEGNHNALLGKNGEYTKLWNLQKGGYIK
ncbi:ABC transporter ATP-binding protein [archaeon]|jgi:ATP-binding cassette, subfamily B, heavy metal transporter|nr:ABC transporter ATP-binding protein [archaeon]